ncbi:MAG: DEAD/DEAH box helicase [Proteobacteria bacterium]|nr:DEAD/DEAH box helicase [Pseudomonadota bacterium]NDC23073.1 DEAD/DEAH box helicase [Pseudomonadota bacterium]NDD04246.1 DEAD/DEAH box helicase [Pseudomonadota bacterium]NDG26331.1 DEAD/DEAH box helicase [Pseudomonadota bacterium]
MESLQNFRDLNLCPPLLSALDKMQFVSPTPIQKASIPHTLAGKDVLGTAQTGTGKTGAFGIPTINYLHSQSDKQVLILAPTRELAAQIFDVLNQMAEGSKLRGLLVVGGESFSRQAQVFFQGSDFIVATPGRLNDHLLEGTMELKHIGLLVLDEVDRMLDMGFAPQIKKILTHLPQQRQTLLFSATLSPEVKTIAEPFLKDPVRVHVGKLDQPAPKVKEETITTTTHTKNDVVLKQLQIREGKILIFAKTQSRTERLARILYDEGHKVVCLHGGRTQGQRKQALTRFRAGTHRIMVATDLAGRGIDVDDVEHVINYDPPQSREDYIHRIGRTGRFGREGSALNLLVSGDFAAEQVFSGKKPRARVIFRSRRPRFQTRLG